MFSQIAERIVTDAVPPTALAGCSARMLEAAVAALDALDAEEAANQQTTTSAEAS